MEPAWLVSMLRSSAVSLLLCSVVVVCRLQGTNRRHDCGLVSIVSRHGVSGLFLAGALAGLMQVIMGLLRLGKFVKFLPQPVIAGFTNGVSILFFMTAVNDALQSPVITLITVVVIVLSLRYFKRIPESLFGSLLV